MTTRSKSANFYFFSEPAIVTHELHNWAKGEDMSKAMVKVQSKTHNTCRKIIRIFFLISNSILLEGEKG
jgi:hypothetical protein